MTYEELIKRVLNGKSVNARAKELGMPQKTLDNYVRGKSAPGCGVTMMMAEVAGVPLAEAVAAVAEQEKKARPNHSATFLRPAMATVLMALIFVVNLFLTPEKAEAAPLLAFKPMQQASNLYYVKPRPKLKSFTNK